MTLRQLPATDAAAAAQALHAQQAGAVAAIVIAPAGADSPPPAGGGAAAAPVRIPLVLVTAGAGQRLANLLAQGAAGGSVTLQSAGDPLYADSEDRLANFSSRGPTLDGRLKPDVVCPGGSIHSAESHGQPTGSRRPPALTCGAVLEMSGTSMATPVCAGAAALARQYFRLGYYPSGAPDGASGFNASAALLKAVLAHGGQPLQITAPDGSWPWWAEAPVLPDWSQGYGRVDLSRVLSFAGGGGGGGGGAGLNLSVWDGVSVQDGAAWAVCLRVASAAAPLRATLVWTDPPGWPGSVRVLVNDLDLTLVDAGGGFWYGNGATEWDETHPAHPARDRVNNAEQATVAAPPAGPLAVRVDGAEVGRGPQAFALVVTGLFSVDPACAPDAGCGALRAVRARELAWAPLSRACKAKEWGETDSASVSG